MNQKTGTWTGETAPPPELLAEAMTAPPIGRDPNPPPSFAVGGYPPDPCTKLLSLRLRDTSDTRRLLEQLRDLPDVLARGGSMTVFVAGEWVGDAEPEKAAVQP